MNVILKTRGGYINTDNGIKVCKENKDATIFEMSDALNKKDMIYREKPMIGKITLEIIRK